ncbi:MAG: tetratricopeptide repeat protein, partial [Blastocatellia bacterium]|nr:tetratricopeptide repeat protein [Blastocatellia bacterium]
AISRLKVEGERASLRATVDLKAINLKSRQKRELRVARNFALVSEHGKWKVWRSAPAENDLADALAKLKTEEERAGLLADEKELASTELARALGDQGDRFYAEGDFYLALALDRLAQGLAEQIGDQLGIASALNKIGKILYSQGNYAQALARFQQSLALSESLDNKAGVATALYNIGNINFRQGDLAQALEHFQKSLTMSDALDDKRGIADALSGIGNIRSSQGDEAQALEHYQKSLSLYEALRDNAGIAKILNNIGITYYDQSNYARALEYFRKSMSLAEAIGDRVGVIRALNNTGNIYFTQENDAQALVYFRKGLALSETLGDKEGVAFTLDNIGYTYEKQGDYAQALDYLQKSLALREEMGGKSGIARTLKNIGNVYFNQVDYAHALERYQKSLALREEMDDKNGVAVSLYTVGKVHYKQGNHALALEFSERAAALARQIGETEVLWRARIISGAEYLALQDPARARQAFEDAITTVETLRADVAGGEGEQQRFFASKVSPYYAMADLLIAQNRPAEALTFAERAKSRVLLDVLQMGRVNVTKAMTGQEQEQERKLNDQLISFNTQISRESIRPTPDQARLTELKAQLQKARLDFEAFQTNLYAAHPDLRTQRGEAQPLRLDEVAALLPDAASALLEYVVTDDKTYLFAITKAVGKAETDIRVYTLPVKRDELDKQTEVFRRQLASRDLGFRASSTKLYELLLKPAEAQLRDKNNLIIAPDDKLWDLPFQALLTGANRFLIEDAAIAYTPSLTVLRETIKRRKNQSADAALGGLLAFGNPLLGKETIEKASLAMRDENLDPLPEAEQEVKALGQLYGAAHSKVYIGAEAREDRLKAEVAQARVIHFATHGILDNASPMYSHLALAQGDKNEDGLLEAWEIMQMDLKADLVVLSACETARGRFGAGEGVIGLSWALFIAGAPATVVSQWKVESSSARDLMINFHRQLTSPVTAKSKATKAEALRQAALKLMKTPETSHPFYWAGFVLVGDAR